MPNLKISQLPELDATPDYNDVLPIVDAGTTKKITVANLFSNVALGINGNNTLFLENTIDLGDITLYNGNPGTTPTDSDIGFLNIPSMNGLPTGIPSHTGDFPGTIPLIFDTANNKLWIYNGGWKSVTLS